MENKKAVLKRTFQRICVLFKDAETLETKVDTISTEKQFEELCLTGNAIITSLIGKLNDVDDHLNNVYSERMKQERKKVIKRTQRKLENERSVSLENGNESSVDGIPTKRTKKNDKKSNSGTLFEEGNIPLPEEGSESSEIEKSISTNIDNGLLISEQRLKEISLEEKKKSSTELEKHNLNEDNNEHLEPTEAVNDRNEKSSSKDDRRSIEKTIDSETDISDDNLSKDENNSKGSSKFFFRKSRKKRCEEVETGKTEVSEENNSKERSSRSKVSKNSEGNSNDSEDDDHESSTKKSAKDLNSSQVANEKSLSNKNAKDLSKSKKSGTFKKLRACLRRSHRKKGKERKKRIKKIISDVSENEDVNENEDVTENEETGEKNDEILDNDNIDEEKDRSWSFFKKSLESKISESKYNINESESDILTTTTRKETPKDSVDTDNQKDKAENEHPTTNNLDDVESGLLPISDDSRVTILLDNSEIKHLEEQLNDSTKNLNPENSKPSTKENLENSTLGNEDNVDYSTEPTEKLIDTSVILVENEPSLIVIQDDSLIVDNNNQSISRNDGNEPEKSDLVGKIKLVDIGKLTNLTEKNATSLYEKEAVPKEVCKIKVADFARLTNSTFDQIDSTTQASNREYKENSLREKSKISEDDKENEKRLKNPHFVKLSCELKKLKEQRKKRLEKERILKEEQEILEAKQKKRKDNEKLKTMECSDDTEANSKRKSKKTQRKSPRPKFVIANNLPIAVVANTNEGRSAQEGSVVTYCVARADEVEDKRLLQRCFVPLTRRTAEELQQEYKNLLGNEEREERQFAMDDDEGSNDGESDCSGSPMVSGSVGKRTSRRPVRSCNSKPISSNNSSRNSSISSRTQRSTRNTIPIVENEISSGSGSEEKDEDDNPDEDVQARVNLIKNNSKGKGRGRPKKLIEKDTSSKKIGKKDKMGGDESDEDDASSHVSISSSSDSEIKKPSNKKSVVKLENSKSAKSSRKNFSESEEKDSDSDIPLTLLPDKKIKNEKFDDSDDLEPTNKKGKKNSTKDTISDSDDTISSKKKIGKKRGGKKKRVVSESGSDYGRDNSESDIESIKSSASEAKEKENPREANKKQSRKRIKRVDDDSSDDSDGRKGKPKKGKKSKGEPIDTRKQIRHILTKGSLNQSTLDAELEESERKKRITDKQKRYNAIYNPEDVENAKLDKVVLDIDEETHEELLSVDKSIVKNLKPHQAKGIQFMWNACYESLDMIDEKGSGCILAHCMGLGKTLQVIALINTLIANSDTTKSEKALVVCPLSTVLNWVSEFKKWLKDDADFEVYELVNTKQVIERQYKVDDWHRNGGVMIMGYDMFRNLSNPENKRVSKKARTTFVNALVDPGPDLVICDEGHLLKNEKTSISIAMNRIRTLRRIVLTGTPLQNNLKEYFCMVQFVKPNLLGTYKEYLNRFVNPITNGQYTDSTPHDIQIMRKRSHVLHKLLDGIVQRRDYGVLAPYLPPKHEYVIFVTLTERQIALYEHYLSVIAPQQRTQSTKGVSLFKDFQEFQRICTHPRVLLDKSVQDQMAKWKEEEENDTDGSEGSLKDFIDDEDDADSTSSDSSKSSSTSKNSHSGPRRGRSKPKPQNTRTTRAVAAEKGIDVGATTSSLEVANTGSEWWREFTTDENLDDLLSSSKLALLFEILHQCEIIGDKILIFSQSLYSLTVIEYFLSKIDDSQQSGDSRLVGGYSGSWSLGLDYFRLDGSSSCDNRAAWCKTFNNPKNTRARLFLISTRAGGLGINLVAANRVIIFDVSWNPSHDIQSIYRVYRFGQVKPSYIYRFVTNGTMEMKVYERQVTKQAISKRVIDEQQIDRHYNQNDLAELYKFEPKPEHRPIPPVPKDILLGELVHDKADLIYKYHEHHTLLENKLDEELNEDERKAAWEEFENEKKMRQMPAHINNIPIHSIMLGLTNHLKREHPDWSAAEIQTAVPSLVQEMQAKMLLGDVSLYNSMILELRNLQQQQQQVQQQRMQDYYRLQQQNQERMLLERHRHLMQNNATVSYLQRLYANATANNLNPAALSALNALSSTLGNSQGNLNQPQIIETVDIND